MTDFDPKNTGYIEVAERIVEFRTKYPEGSLQPADISKPFSVIDIAGQTYLAYVAAAYRHPEDPRPGIGSAYEVVPGKTKFTRGSELMNAETSAWGRAIVAALAADTKKGIATREEIEPRRIEARQIEARQGERSHSAPVENSPELEALRSQVMAEHEKVFAERGQNLTQSQVLFLKNANEKQLRERRLKLYDQEETSDAA